MTLSYCIFPAIFPDVLLVFGALLLFLIIVDIFVVIFLIYLRYGKKKDPDEVSKIRTSVIKWAATRENLSLGFSAKRVSKQYPQLHRLARKLKLYL